jgi:hypothetical protein
MFFKKNKNVLIFFLALLFFLIFSTFVTLSLNSELRRSIFSKSLVLHDFYRIQKMITGLQNRNFSLISKRLQEHIDFSKLIAKDKNYMFAGIYEATDLAVSRATEQDDYNSLENIFKQLIELDNRVYKPHVWYARSLSDSDVNKALKHLDIAIKISPSESEAYREIIRIGQNQNDVAMTSKYCKIYKMALSGGKLPKDYAAFFRSFNNDKFAIRLFSKNNIKYTDFLSSTILLNNDNNYEFLVPQELTEIGGLNLYFSTAEALKIKFKKIYYYEDDRIHEISHKDITITSRNSYIEENEENMSVFLSPKKDEIIRIKHDFLEKIKKIKIEMRIEKMNLAGKSLCGK